MPPRAAVITVSTSRAGGVGTDRGGPALEQFARGLGLQIAGAEVIADDRDLISEKLRYWCDAQSCDLVLTTGGTGFAPSDVTPEATREVIEREAPGLAEAMRSASRDYTHNWMLSRGVCGIRGRSLIINFPGSPKSITQAGAAVSEALPHALALIRGEHPAHR